MIIDNLHAVRITITPPKTDTILFIDSNTVLAFSYSMKLFESIARRNTKVVQRDRSVEHPKFSEGDSLHFSRQFLRELASEYLFRFPTFE
jgi:hypothetical protein